MTTERAFTARALLLLVILAGAAPAAHAAPATAVFAMGCFWCGEEVLQKLPGVLCVESGYAGGSVVCPTYYQVVRENTGHLEVVRVVYDDALTDYETLLGHFWHNVNPLQNDGQFCDRGGSYRSAIFYNSPEQEAAALASKEALENENSWSIVTEVLPLNTFYVAEASHQNYFLTNSVPYNRYKTGCRRVPILKEVWGTEAYNEYHQNTVPLNAGDETCGALNGEDRVLVDVCSVAGSPTGGSGGSPTGGSGGSVGALSAEGDGSPTGGSSDGSMTGASHNSQAAAGSYTPSVQQLVLIASLAAALLSLWA